MGTRFEQEAADTLQGYADRAARDWQRFKDASKAVTTTWAPVLTEQQKQEHEQYVIEHDLPF